MNYAVVMAMLYPDIVNFRFFASLFYEIPLWRTLYPQVLSIGEFSAKIFDRGYLNRSFAVFACRIKISCNEVNV